MAKRKTKIREYLPKYTKDETGEHYRIVIPYKEEKIEILIDLADFERFREHNWSVLVVNGKPRYISRMLHNDDHTKRQRQLLHHFIMGVRAETSLDHINGNGFDCRSYNLRVATAGENARNRKKRIPGTTTSKYKGVCWKKNQQRWVGQIKYKGKAIHLGSYRKEVINNIDEGEIRAAKAYDKAAIKYFGSFALINFGNERNIVQTIKGEYFKQTYLFNEQEVKRIERKIKELSKLTGNEIMEILEAISINEIVDMCHYFGCGIEKLIKEVKKGVVIGKKYA